MNHLKMHYYQQKIYCYSVIKNSKWYFVKQTEFRQITINVFKVFSISRGVYFCTKNLNSWIAGESYRQLKVSGVISVVIHISTISVPYQYHITSTISVPYQYHISTILVPYQYHISSISLVPYQDHIRTISVPY